MSILGGKKTSHTEQASVKPRPSIPTVRRQHTHLDGLDALSVDVDVVVLDAVLARARRLAAGRVVQHHGRRVVVLWTSVWARR